MIHELHVLVFPEQAESREAWIMEAAKTLHVRPEEIKGIRLVKRSIDARRKPVRFQLKLEVSLNEELHSTRPAFPVTDVSNRPQVVIIGAGPAGLFAALRAIQLGLCPIIYERGKDVKTRRRDLARINKEHLVDSESNYCFGEGGAGTYSDGKLYTRSKKRGSVQQVLEWLVAFGANPNILIDAHPHIGTNRLPQIITAIREHIIACGGEVHFESKLTDFSITNNRITHVIINENEQIPVEHVILATGHSARDIFYLLNNKGVALRAKPFALGVRIEHPQELIDSIQYHGETDNPHLPPASYSLVEQVDGMGVYSFCMCPGGIVAPCATAQDEVVTNGWSPSKRNNPYANSGIVVQVSPEDLPGDPNDPFICLKFQQSVEKSCWETAGKTQAVPAQRMIDFVENRISSDLPKSSYQPGLVSVNLNEVLPDLLSSRLRKAFNAFGKKMKGYYTNEAVLHAPESRTSSPVQIPRDKETLEHIEVKGLYPCAEGAGYAGGIVSAAIDGMNCVEKIVEKLNSSHEVA
jgi:uncharacterized protein